MIVRTDTYYETPYRTPGYGHAAFLHRPTMTSEPIGQTYFRGASGTTYKFVVFHPDADVPSVGGVFLVSGIPDQRPRPDHRRVMLIGRSADMARTADQLTRHASLEGVEQRRLCIYVEDDNWRRRSRIAKDIAAAHRPQIRMNV